MTELLTARTILCDLLIGRAARLHAAKEFEAALHFEAMGMFPVDVTQVLDRAAHWEWIASISEHGLVCWGSRLNRCGPSPDPEPA